ncbi:MAG: hypothetical protein KDD94_13265, partial [Calditrichaeota bacterium]|nr:hypothetical protein [Calditrichota bacterium]
QYIKNPREFLQNIWRILADNGEIHIIDTPFYEQSEIAAAKQRSSDYFASIGFHEMTRFYYHHSYESLGPIEFEILNDPLPDWRRILNLFAIRSPFPWLKIKKSSAV